MAWTFNPFTGSFDQKGSGGGGSSYLEGEVQNFSALPTSTPPAVDAAYLVREAEGAWLLNRKPAGIYIRVATTGTRATDWTYAGEFPDVFSDANFLLYDESDSTKNLKFQLSGITTGTTRTLTAPDASGTIALLSNFLSAFKDAVVISPSADMSVTSDIVVADVSGMSFTAAANTSYVYAAVFYIDVGSGAHNIELNVNSLLNGNVNGWGFHIAGQNVVQPSNGISATNIRLNRAAGGNSHTGPAFSIGGFRTVSSGTVKVQFAQASSNGAASVLKDTSRMIFIPVT
jgi:hypothetical protein